MTCSLPAAGTRPSAGGHDLLVGDSGNDTLQGMTGTISSRAGPRAWTTINGTGTDQAVTPAVGSPAMVSLETVLANDTALRPAAMAARQAWLNQFLATTDTTDDFIDRTESRPS